MILDFLVVPIEITLVLVNAPLITLTPFLDDMNYQIDHLLNHVLIVVEVDSIQILTCTPIILTNPLSISLNSLLHLPITSPPLNLKLQLKPIFQLLLSLRNILLPLIIILTLDRLPPG